MADIRALTRAWRCRRLAAALVDYAAGELPPAARRRVEGHLAGCAACAATVTALADLPAPLRGTVPPRDEAFWHAQRTGVMDAIRAGSGHRERPPRLGFDWRLALPVAAAVAIAFAGYLSLRSPSAPGEIALDVLPPEDLSALMAIAEGIMPSQEWLPDIGTGAGGAVGGAVDAGWIRADELPPPTGWGELDDDDLEALHGMVG
jgi:anti-sigma factor RsiW